MGWIQYPTKTTIAAGLKAADPAAAGAAKMLADVMIAQLDRLNDRRAVEGMVYSALKRAANESAGREQASEATGRARSGKANKFDLLYLARIHGQTIVDLSVAMTVFIAREEEGEPIKGADLEELVMAAMKGLGA